MENKTKHTPGPWRIEQCAGSTVEIGAATGIGKRLVFKGQFRLEDCALGNAALIAAAPDMLEALEHCLAYFKAKGVIDDRACSPWNDALEAIKKARGE